MQLLLIITAIQNNTDWVTENWDEATKFKDGAGELYLRVSDNTYSATDREQQRTETEQQSSRTGMENFTLELAELEIIATEQQTESNREPRQSNKVLGWSQVTVPES